MPIIGFVAERVEGKRNLLDRKSAALSATTTSLRRMEITQVARSLLSASPSTTRLSEDDKMPRGPYQQLRQLGVPRGERLLDLEARLGAQPSDARNRG